MARRSQAPLNACVPRRVPPLLAVLSVARTPAGALEKVWMNDLIRGLPWRPNRQLGIDRVAHISLQELDNYIGLCCYMARSHPGTRGLFLLDSRVTIGASAKGRSASKALNYPLRAGIAEFVGCDFYPGADFVPTRFNPGDKPSRLRRLDWQPALL